MFEFLVTPSFPNAAIGIDEQSISALAIAKSSRGEFRIRQAATVELPEGVLTPDFQNRNIVDEAAFVDVLEAALLGSGLMGQKKWSVSLPGNTARTAIVTLETEPASKQEFSEIFDWKAEQTFGAPAAEMRISRQRVPPDAEGRSRFLATAIRLATIDEFENVFERFGWRAGLILPRAISESAWLSRSSTAEDSLLLSSQSDGFTALLLKNGEPVVVRSVTCRPNEASDEIYRLLMFYNDRFGGAGGKLERILVVGEELTKTAVSEIAAEAFGRTVNILEPADLRLDLGETGLGFNSIAAPAGLASLA